VRTQLLEAGMRDGTVLRADVYRPTGDGPWPVLLARTPYGKRDPGVLARLDPSRACARGYLVVIQDCRGRYASEGRWEPLVHEGADGYDTICWAAKLPDSDGRVATYGPSYLGYTQWAAMHTHPPELHAAMPEFTWADTDDGLISRGGAYELGLITQWTLGLGYDVLRRRYADRPAHLREQLDALDIALGGLAEKTYWEVPVGQTVHRLDLPLPNSQPASTPTTVATLTVAGWFDAFLQGSLDNYVRARDAGTPAALIVGPWAHDNQTRHVGDVDFGPLADAERLDGSRSLLDRQLDWLDQQLSQVEPDEPPVLLFMMGANEWRRLPAWPPEAVDDPWYLRDGGELAPEPHRRSRHRTRSTTIPPTRFRPSAGLCC